MTNQNPAQGYEIGIFNQLVKNSEAIALTQFKVEELSKQVIKLDDRLKDVEVQVNKIPEIETHLTNVETRLTRIEQIGEKILGSIKYFIGAIALGILINILSSPIVTRLYNF
ncbi:MAG: hypothetical protein QNJ60_15630 [Xenococcaceae cyanobacterium MO_188.B19]|nr:hypothetical protein [Xenococcaceae cyanobacterium MO_188.B19]